jgi:hypothetical protein
MADTPDRPDLPVLDPEAVGSARDFLKYARQELERRLGRGDDLDGDAYRKAVELVLSRLDDPEEEMVS